MLSIAGISLSVFFAISTIHAATAQQQTIPPPPPPEQTKPQDTTPSQSAQPPSEDNPPEEDDNEKPKVYTFNPIQSESEIKVGLFYMHKSSWRAAAKRFDEATKWNPNSAEAFFRLGEAREKLKEKDAARTAYQKVVMLSPDSKEGKEAKKKLSSK
jgi:tetratricopeptide (TPR) repeat protein